VRVVDIVRSSEGKSNADNKSTCDLENVRFVSVTVDSGIRGFRAGFTGPLSTAGRAFKPLLGHFKPDMANIYPRHCPEGFPRRRRWDVHQLSVINHWWMDQNQRLQRRANMSRYKISFNLKCQEHKTYLPQLDK